MKKHTDWSLWRDIQRAMKADGMPISDRLLKEAAEDWEARKEWRVIRALILDAKRKGVKVHELMRQA